MRGPFQIYTGLELSQIRGGEKNPSCRKPAPPQAPPQEKDNHVGLKSLQVLKSDLRNKVFHGCHDVNPAYISKPPPTWQACKRETIFTTITK